MNIWARKLAINQNALRRKKKEEERRFGSINKWRKKERKNEYGKWREKVIANLLGEAEGVNSAVSDIPVEEAVRILSSDNGKEGNEEEEERGSHCEEGEMAMEIGGRDWFIFKRRGSGSADCRVGSECTKP